MQTPTLIVRLLGLYLTITGIQGLVTLYRMRHLAKSIDLNISVSIANHPLTHDALFWLIGSLLVGLFMTWRAGWLAHLLTFDADGARRSGLSFSDRLLD